MEVFPLFLKANFAALVLIGIIFRVTKLANVPGLNSDEYFHLVSIRELIAGTSTHGFMVPTGRVLDFFYAIPAYLIDVIVPRSASTIRWASTLSGLVMGAVAYPMMRKSQSPLVSAIVTVFCLITPVQISYSRIGWEYSQIPLATLLIVAGALDRRIWISAVAFVAGLLVHPAIAYLFPILLFTIAYKLFARLEKRDAKSLAVVFGLPALAVAGFAAMLALTLRDTSQQIMGMLGSVTSNLRETGQQYFYIQLYSNLFGVGVSRQNLTDTPRMNFDTSNAAFMATMAFLYLAYFFTYAERRKKDPSATNALWVVIGLLCAIVGFFLTRGVQSIHPPLERYGLFLVTPTIIVLAVMADSLADSAGRKAFMAVTATLAAWMIVAEFKTGYFDYFANTGGENAHITYKSNVVDPKVAALDWVKSRGPNPVIYTKEWRTYWPVQYVASVEPSVRVVLMTQSEWTGGLSPQEFTFFRTTRAKEFDETIRGTHGYVLGYPDGGFENNLRTALPGATISRKDFNSRSGEPVVSVWYVEG